MVGSRSMSLDKGFLNEVDEVVDLEVQTKECWMSRPNKKVEID